jgi:hypothetical protein
MIGRPMEVLIWIQRRMTSCLDNSLTNRVPTKLGNFYKTVRIESSIWCIIFPSRVDRSCGVGKDVEEEEYTDFSVVVDDEEG